MQKLYENADQPVQQVIEKILLDDLDQISNFGYGSSSAQKKRVKTPTANNSLAKRHTDHVKYEFIEKLLRQPDKELTSKTLQEMAFLYQDLVEKN